MTSCASANERIHSASSNCFEVESFSFFRNIRLCVEQEATFLRPVACRPFDCQNVKASKQASPLTSSCEGDNGIQVFLPFSGRARSTHQRRFNVR